MRIAARRIVITCGNHRCPHYGREVRIVQYWNYKSNKWASVQCPECGSRSLSLFAEEEFYEYREDGWRQPA